MYLPDFIMSDLIYSVEIAGMLLKMSLKMVRGFKTAKHFYPSGMKRISCQTS